VTLPDRAADGDLAPHHVEHAFAIDPDAGVLLENRRQRSAALESYLEAEIFQAEQQTVDRPLRDTHRKRPSQPAAHRKWLVGVEQRIDELADAFLGDLSQRPNRVLGDRI